MKKSSNRSSGFGDDFSEWVGSTEGVKSMDALKGGSAMRLFDNLTSRLSIDADFSVEDIIYDDKMFFAAIKSSVETSFHNLRLYIIDFKIKRKPKNKKKNKPDWWGGWSCEFKLVSHDHRGKSIEAKRRNALIPEGANSSKIIMDISEHEYCGKKRTKNFHGIKILGYSRELLVLEKIRAICQQHPNYAYRLSKNRARDFYDIYELTVDVDDNFANRCKHHIEKVFKAKEVPLEILKSLWMDDFIDEQRRGFDQVKNTVSGGVKNFDVYVEYLRFLVKDIYPNFEKL
jgi:hypothetical protein